MEPGGRPEWLDDGNGKVLVISELRSFLGFTWWRSHVESANGMDIVYAPPFRARVVERAEAKALDWYRRIYVTPGDRRIKREYEL